MSIHSFFSKEWCRSGSDSSSSRMIRNQHNKDVKEEFMKDKHAQKFKHIDQRSAYAHNNLLQEMRKNLLKTSCLFSQIKINVIK